MPTKKIFDIYPPKIVSKKEDVKKAKSRKILAGGKLSSLQLKKSLIHFGSKKVFIIGLGALAVLVFFLHISARVEIEVWPKTEILSFEKDLIVDSNVQDSDFVKSIIPGQFFSEVDELSQEFSSSGVLTKEIKATGTIRVFNEYNLSQALVNNTRFISANGKLFYSREYANISPGQNRDVSVIAAEPGPEYNIKSTNFSIPGLLGSPRYTAVYGKSLNQMEGGAITQASQISKEDLAQAESTILDKLKFRLQEKLDNRAGNLFVLLEQTVETTVLEKSASKKEGEEAEKFDFFVKASAKGLFFQESSAKDFAQKWILEQLSDGKEIKSQSLTQEYVFKKLDISEGKMYLKVKISAEIFTSIDEQGLKGALSGNPIKESVVLLGSNQEFEKTKVRLFPFWLKKIPEDISRIKVSVKVVD